MTMSFVHKTASAAAIAVSALVGVAAPAVAADHANTDYEAVTPMSKSQSQLLRGAPEHSNDVTAGEPANENVPASRSQIEVLDRSHAHVAQSEVR